MGEARRLLSSSASTSGGNVGDKRGGSLGGDGGGLGFVCASEARGGFALTVASDPVSRRFLSSLCESWSSMLRRSGESRGGKADLDDLDGLFASALVGVCRWESAGGCLLPFIELPRGREGGESGRGGLASVLGLGRPFGSASRSVLRCSSRLSRSSRSSRSRSRGRCDVLSSPARLPVSEGRGRLGGRDPSSPSAMRFLVSGVGGFAGREDFEGGFGGSL